MKLVAGALFILTYVLMLALPQKRAHVAVSSALLFILLGIVPLNRTLALIDWNVIMLITGTMGIVSLFIDSKMPALLADILINKTSNVKWAIVTLSFFAGFISAFMDNVATVLMVAPVAITIARKLNISPVPSVIAIAVSSNLQGAATLVGDTTSILLGGYAGMDFMDFFAFMGKPGIFWIVQAGALASMLVLLFLFRKENDPISQLEKAVVEDYFPSLLLVGLIVLLILASFIPDKPATTNGLISMGLLIVGLARLIVKTKDIALFQKTLAEIDFFTITLLAGLFLVVGALTETGIVRDISNLFVKVSSGNVFYIYTLLVWASVFFSAFIDNIPFVATMLPVVSGIAAILNIEPFLLYFGLLSGATLGGNLTPIGASANITAIGILRREGYEIGTWQFMRIGVPFTLAAVTTGYLLLWVIWS